MKSDAANEATTADPQGDKACGTPRNLTVLIGMATAALMLIAGARVGEVLNDFAFDPMFVGIAVLVALVFGFAAGWFARSAVNKH